MDGMFKVANLRKGRKKGKQSRPSTHDSSFLSAGSSSSSSESDSSDLHATVIVEATRGEKEGNSSVHDERITYQNKTKKGALS